MKTVTVDTMVLVTSPSAIQAMRGFFEAIPPHATGLYVEHNPDGSWNQVHYTTCPDPHNYFAAWWQVHPSLNFEPRLTPF